MTVMLGLTMTMTGPVDRMEENEGTDGGGAQKIPQRRDRL